VTDPRFLDRPPRRRRFGQHFLHDPSVLERIVGALQPASGDRIVEIGPGGGALTQLLLESGIEALDAVEIDRDLAGLLRDRFATYSGFTLHRADALNFDFAELARSRGGPLRIVGNLPYNISTPLLFHLLASAASIEDMHVMLQREVAERIAAAPGNASYGRLTIMLAPWVSVEPLFEVGPGAFRPPPKVWSTVLRLSVRPQPSFQVSPHFAQVVSAAFSHRRKTLRNALRSLITPEQIQAAGQDPGVRPEKLAPEAFNALAHQLDCRGDTPARQPDCCGDTPARQPDCCGDTPARQPD
jgi:16S rRNA (adenine1518-N6/adenine1519-N6)-dimethyltransferase